MKLIQSRRNLTRMVTITKEQKCVIWCYISSQYEDFSPASGHILPWILKNIPKWRTGAIHSTGALEKRRKRNTTMNCNIGDSGKRCGRRLLNLVTQFAPSLGYVWTWTQVLKNYNYGWPNYTAGMSVLSANRLNFQYRPNTRSLLEKIL